MARVLFCLLGLLAAMAAALTLVAATPPLSWSTFTVASLAILAGFLGLQFAATVRAPLRPLRLSLGVALPLNLYLLWGLPFPPHGNDAAPVGLLLACLLLASAIWLWPGRWPRLAFAGLVVLGAVALLSMPRMAAAITAAAASGQYAGPAVALSVLTAATLQMAWLASIWHGRSLARGHAQTVGAA